MPFNHPRRRLIRAVTEALENRQMLAFGLTTTASNYIVDTGAGVVFTILRQGSSSTIHSGDLTSFKLNGVEFGAPYASSSRFSHFESGLSNSSAISASVDPAGNWIKITCDDSNAVTGTGGTGVIQYYIAKKNDPNIYMATYAPEMKVSSTRYITYLDSNKFPYRPAESDNSNGTGPIESADVTGHADGTSTSKYYGETRNIDHLYHGASGPAAGAYMFIGDRESGAGGPFWKDIDWQSGPSQVEIYNMPYSAHSLSDAFRPGLHGPYALNLTNGTPPVALPEYTFLDGVGLAGWVPASGRGSLSGRATGVLSGHQVTVGLSNAEAQYWDTPDAMGNYAITGIKPGTYTESLYDEELVVGTRTVTITAGQASRADIAAVGYYGFTSSSTNALVGHPSNVTPIWQIGKWDGTPREFLNGDKITIMHPQDSRLSPWADSTGTTNFTVGVDPDSAFPMAEWHTQAGTGDGPYYDTKNRIYFNLDDSQITSAMTLRIGITRLDHGRPSVSINGAAGTTPNLTTQVSGRGLTLGNWRGNNSIYSFTVSPASLHAGLNYIDIFCASGSTGTLYSGYHIYDAIDLIPSSSAALPAIASITIAPGTGSNLGVGGTHQFFAIAKDITDIERPANIVWTTDNGSINDAGEYTAPATPGTATITATYGAVSASVTINLNDTAPIVVTPASASANPTYSKTTTLSVLGADDAGEAGLTYTWSVVGDAPGPVSFTAGNGTSTAKSIGAAFSEYGNYTLQVTIADGSGNSTVSRTVVSALNEKIWYRFDRPNGSGLTDYSGNGQFASAYGRFTFPGGVHSGSLNFAGGAATLPSGVVAGLTDFTVATWVKPDALSDLARIFDFGTGTNAYMSLISRTSAAGNPIQFSITNSGPGGEQTVTGPALASGTWTHVAISLSGSTATLYVNGVAVGTNSSMTLTPSSLGSTNLNFIGESQFASDPSFRGSIDDFRVYARALSRSEVAALANVQLIEAPSDLSGSVVSQNQIDLNWVDESDNESAFEIEIATGGGAFTLIKTVGADVTSAQITELSPSTLYDFRVRAVNAQVQSDYSNTYSDSTLAAPTPPPPVLGSISGVCFNDTNADGVQNGTETRGVGKKVFLDRNGNDQYDVGEQIAISDANGEWSFTNLPAGSYFVRRVFPKNYRYSTPPRDVKLAAGQDAAGVTIGSTWIVRPGSISGYVFLDANRNGRQDSGESPAVSALVFLDTNNDGLKQKTEYWLRADSKGYYRFTNLFPKTYHIRALLGTGQQLTTPKLDVALSAGQFLSRKMIGIA